MSFGGDTCDVGPNFDRRRLDCGLPGLGSLGDAIERLLRDAILGASMRDVVGGRVVRPRYSGVYSSCASD